MKALRGAQSNDIIGKKTENKTININTVSKTYIQIECHHPPTAIAADPLNQCSGQSLLCVYLLHDQ